VTRFKAAFVGIEECCGGWHLLSKSVRKGVNQEQSMSTFKDLFSTQSLVYSQFRPGYSDELFDDLQTLTEGHSQAWDAGTGNGQAAQKLIKHFDHVIATDPSEKQIAQAMQNSKITYLVEPAEKTSIKNESVDLITVAQAFHWFKQPEFFAEVKRVAKPNAVLALWCYELAMINPTVDAEVMKLYEGVLGPYWEKDRKLVEEGYQNVQIPFTEIKVPKFQLHAEWSFEHLIGYLGTWSALQTYIKKNNSNPLEVAYAGLKKSWGEDATKPVTWNLGLRVVRI
jgi:ubiquinone/menaquinone biosynthesis C-methylase UbiE